MPNLRAAPWLLALAACVSPVGSSSSTLPVGTPPTATSTVAGPPLAVSPEPQLPTLTADPPPGLSFEAVTVTLTSAQPDAEIWFTQDGTAPIPRVSARYTGPLTLTDSALLRAIATHGPDSASFAGVWLRGDADVRGFSSDLPLVVLWSGLQAPEVKEEAYTSFTVSTFSPDATGRIAWPALAGVSSRAGLKIRGSSSAGYPKHPYRLEAWGPRQDLDADVPMLGLPSEADWVLSAPLAFDRAFVRDALMYALSNSVGRYAPRTAFAEVFVAEGSEGVGLDDYVGIYVVTEHIERGDDRVDLARLDPTDVLEPDVSGGYIFKEDRVGPGESGFYAGSAGVFSFQQPFVYADPPEADLVPAQRDYLTAQLDELGGALASPDFTNPTTGRHYSAIIDVDAWIDHHILNVYAKNPDAFRLSGYFSKDREGPIAAGPLWDFDRTLGCDSDNRAADPTWWDNSNETPDCTFVWEEGFWPGLFSDPAFRAAYFARWRTLLDGPLSTPVVHAQLDAFAAQLEEASARNYAAWPDYPPRGGSLDSEMALLKTWVSARHDWIAGCLDLPDPRTCTGD